MLRTKTCKTQRSELLAVVLAVMVALALTACAPDFGKITAVADDFDVAQSGTLVAEQLKDGGSAGVAPTTYTLVVAGEGAGEDLRDRLREAGYKPEQNPDLVPETFWEYVDASGEHYNVVVKDLAAGDTAPLVVEHVPFVIDSVGAVITFKQ